jgi:hypothetical protein
MEIDPRLNQVVKDQPYPLLFVTISGAHLYGFASADSDYDLRGVHILPPSDVMGLNPPKETLERSHHPAVGDAFELDLVTHDIKKFMLLMLKKNGYVLEQLLSPLMVHTTDEHEELKRIAANCITRYHAHHYLGFARTQWELFGKEKPPRVKPLLYVYRVLLTGIHLMQAGEIEANLVRLNETFNLSYINELIQQKVEGAEQATLNHADLSFYREEYLRLTVLLEESQEKSTLPEIATAKDELSKLLISVRKLHEK